MITRPLSYLTDIIIFLLTYCFIFVSVLILFFDRNTDYDRFISAFYILIAIAGYLYFILPLFFKGQTLGKRIFKITLVTNKGAKNILLFHVKYIFFRLLPLVSVLLVFELNILFFQILFGLLSFYPIFDYIYLKANEICFTDKLLKMTVKVY